MAELFGVISGGAGIASLVLQLAEDAQKLRKLYHSIKDAPECLERISHEVSTFSLLLRLVEKDRWPHDGECLQVLQQCTGLCEQIVSRIRLITEKLESALTKNRTWGKIKVVYKEEDLVRLFDDLERAKTLLLQASVLLSGSARRYESSDAAQTLNRIENAVNRQTHLLTSSQLSIWNGGSQAANADAVRSADPSSERQLLQYLESYRMPRSRTKSRYQFRLRPWFVSKIWEISVSDLYSGWNIQLTTRNRVPKDAPILQACHAGSLPEVRRLITAGKASPLDFCDNHINGDVVTTSFQAALYSRDLELVKYLFRYVGWSEVDFSYHHWIYLGWFSGGLEKQQQLQWNRLFLEHPDVDVDFLANGSINGAARYCHNHIFALPEIMPLMKKSLALSYSALPLSVRLRNAMNIENSNPPSVFREMLELEFSDPIFATTHSPDGCDGHLPIGWTVLRFAVRQYARGKFASLWEKAIRQLIGAGAPLAVDDEGHTVLDSIIAIDAPGAMVRRLRQFLQILLDCRIDLEIVATSILESIMRSGRPSVFDSYRGPNLRVDLQDLIFGPRPEDWDLKIHFMERVVVTYPTLPTSLPGSWPKKSMPLYLPYISILSPNRDPLEKHRRSSGRSICFCTTTILASQYKQFVPVVPQQAAFFNTQDDTGPLMQLLRHEEAHSPRLRRSTSSPPDFRSSHEWGMVQAIEARMYVEITLSQERWPYTRDVHRCRIDGRWKLGYWPNHLRCVQSQCQSEERFKEGCQISMRWEAQRRRRDTAT